MLRHLPTLPLTGIALLAGALGLLAAPARSAPGEADAAKAAPPQASDVDRAEEKAEAKAKAQALKPAEPLPRLAEDGGRGLRVVVIPIKGTIDLGLAPFVDRVLNESGGAALIVLDVDTFGGRVDAAVKIRDRLLGTKVPVLAYVNRRAISAGALISLAARYIVFSPGGSMGAATPIQLQGGQAKAVGEKMVSYMRSEMRATAEARGWPGDLAEAMVDADVAIEGVTKKGKLLTATTEMAMEWGLANAEHGTLPEVLEALGLEHAEQWKPSENWAEQIARFLTDPVVSGALMSLGMLGLLIELYTPGVGLAGGVGVVCLVLFFGGHMVVELAGWEEVVLFLVGLLALGLEVFVIPGFGVAGVVGIVLIVMALVLAMVGLPLGVSWDAGAIGAALGSVLLSLAATVVGLLILMRYLPRTGLASWLILDTKLGATAALARAKPEADPSFVAPDVGLREYLGRSGVAASDLRLAGKARIEGELVDVVSQVDYIDRGEPIRVVEVEGVRVVVVRDDPPTPPSPTVSDPT